MRQKKKRDNARTTPRSIARWYRTRPTARRHAWRGLNGGEEMLIRSRAVFVADKGPTLVEPSTAECRGAGGRLDGPRTSSWSRSSADGGKGVDRA